MTAVKTTMLVKDIKLGKRLRKDLGDVTDLAESIKDVGLLNPITIDSNNNLVAGGRRLAACKLLKWKQVPVTVIDLDDYQKVRAEIDENVKRKYFNIAETVASSYRLEDFEREAAKKRKRHEDGLPENFSEAGDSREKVAKAVGMSFPNLKKARDLVASKRKDLIAQLEEGQISLDAAWRELTESTNGTTRNGKAKASRLDRGPRMCRVSMLPRNAQKLLGELKGVKGDAVADLIKAVRKSLARIRKKKQAAS